MSEKIVLYLGSGVMAGVFSAGVVTELEKSNVYNDIEALYSCSAGTFNAAYFLAKQSELGSRIYWEDLSGDRFINFKRFLCGRPNGVDIDYLLNVSNKVKVLDVDAIKNQSIPFFVKLLNNKTGEVAYHNGKEETFDKLRSATSVFPLYCNTKDTYIDAGIREPVGLDYLLHKHPKSRIILITNHQPKVTFLYIMCSYLVGILAQIRRPDLPFFKFFRERVKSLKKDLKIALKEERICFIHPPKSSPTRAFTTDKIKLLKTYEMGKLEASKVIKFMERKC